MVIALLIVGPREKSTFITRTFRPFLTWPQQRLDKCAYQLRHICLSGCKTYAEVIFSFNWKYITISITIEQKCRTFMYKIWMRFCPNQGWNTRITLCVTYSKCKLATKNSILKKQAPNFQMFTSSHPVQSCKTALVKTASLNDIRIN